MEGKTKTDLFDLKTINKVPITMWSGELDTTCSNWEARNTKETIGERVTNFRTVRGADHGFWGGKKVSDELFKELAALLINPDPNALNTSYRPLFLN